MQYRILGRTGLQISAVSLGAWEVGGAAQLTFEGLGSIPHGWAAPMMTRRWPSSTVAATPG